MRITLEAEPGESIKHAATEAVRLANFLGITIWFDFNSIHTHANPGEDPADIAIRWKRHLSRPENTCGPPS